MELVMTLYIGFVVLFLALLYKYELKYAIARKRGKVGIFMPLPNNKMSFKLVNLNHEEGNKYTFKLDKGTYIFEDAPDKVFFYKNLKCAVYGKDGVQKTIQKDGEEFLFSPSFLDALLMRVWNTSKANFLEKAENIIKTNYIILAGIGIIIIMLIVLATKVNDIYNTQKMLLKAVNSYKPLVKTYLENKTIFPA